VHTYIHALARTCYMQVQGLKFYTYSDRMCKFLVVMNRSTRL